MALQATGTAPSITTDPTDHTSVNITDNTWVDSVKNTSLIWNLSGDIYTIQKQVNNGSKTNINGFNLRFSNGSNDESSLPALTIESWQNNSAEKAGILVGTSVTSLTLDFQNKGLQLQGAGELKTWTIHFQGSGKTLNVNNLQSLEGNLNIYTDNFADIGENTYIFSLKSMTGDIQISGAKGGMQKGEITFDQTGLRGDILSFTDIAATSENGGITVKFNGSSTMVGDIKGAKSGNDLLKRTVIFNTDSSSPALVGNIFSYGTDISTTPTLGRSVGNHIVFTKGNMQGSIVASNGVIGNNSAKKGYNSITFNSGTEQTLTGGILADDSHHNGSDTQATNTLNVGANTTLKIIASEKNQISDTTQVQSNDSTKPNTKTFDLTTGSIIARGGINEVNLAKNAALVLDSGNGNIETLSNGSNSNTKSKIFFNGASGTLQGNIATNAGVATITIANDASGTITGNITKTGGTNNITLGVNTPITYIRGVQTQPAAPAATSASLTLQGVENAISTLTTTAASSTLTIDASNNSNNTTIATVTGNNLIADFKSVGENTATLTLDTATNRNLKSVSASSGTNNTLVLTGTDTMVINDAVTIDTDKGIIFDLGSGSNITFTSDITTNGTTTFKLGGTNNIITGTLTNNGTYNFDITGNAVLQYNNGLTFTSGNNNINFIDNATLDWQNTSNQAQAITTSGGTTTINVANTKNGTINNSITTSGGSTNIVLGNANTGLADAPTPTTLTLKGTINQITSITANVDGAKLVLDTSINKNETTLGSVSGDNKLTVDFNGENTDSGKTAKLTLNGNAKLKAITLEANSKNNALTVASGSTSVNDNFSLTTGQEMSFEIKANSNLAFANGLTNTGGTLNIKSEGTAQQAIQTGMAGNISTSDGTTNLYFKDSLWTPAFATTREGTTSGTISVSGGTSNIVVELSSASGLGKTAMYDVVTNGGTNNVLVKGTTDIGAQVTYEETGKTNLMFVSGSSGTLSFDATDNSDFSNENFKPSSGVKLFGINFTDGVMLTLQDKKVKSGSGEASFLSLAGKDSANPAFSFTTQRDTSTNTDTVKLHGVAVGKIQAIGGTVTQDPSTPTVHTYNVILNEGAIFAGNIALYGTNQVINLTMKDSSKLFMNNEALQIENLGIQSNGLDLSNIKGSSFSQKNTIIDLASDGNSFENISRDISTNGYRVLVIGSRSNAGAKPYVVAPTGLTGNNGLFRVYVDPKTEGTLGGTIVSGAFGNTKAYADRILVNDGSQGTHYIQAIYKEGTEIGKISYNGGGVETEGNIAVATVKDGLGITFEGADQIQGFDVIGTKLTEGIETDAQGQVNGAGTKNYKTFFIDSTVSKGIADGSIQTTTSALGINYDLFLANFNSLNKRMGELRDNNNGQGAWARVFVGGLSTSYGLETQSTYTTIQAGYDYAFGFEGANNYLGVALSYANALTDTKKSIDVGGVVSGIDKTSTNGIEVALYNSYIEDSGWFNDTIFKFSYMMSDVKVINQSDTYSTNNFGIVLSDEFGYRFKLGESKEWYIDPQLEVGFGYFNQSDLKQVLGQATLTGIQNAIATLRARVGANWAYDFKKFTQGKGINASVYLGTYYSYDYISGGEISLVTDLGTKGNLKPLSSTGRFELNVGTNIGVQDNTRIYFDFEKSFGGDITTDYQVNLGVRYSFGECNGYTPISAIKTKTAPLKVSDKKPQEQPSQENTSSEEKTDTNKTEQKAQ